MLHVAMVHFFRVSRSSTRPTRRGASHARNAGARASTGDVLAFCDADDEVAPGWIAGLQKGLLDNEFVASRFDLTKLNPSLGWVHPQASGLIQDPSFDFLPRAGGCGLAVRRHIHDSVGGFDEHIRFHEDTDYCWKIQTDRRAAWLGIRSRRSCSASTQFSRAVSAGPLVGCQPGNDLQEVPKPRHAEDIEWRLRFENGSRFADSMSRVLVGRASFSKNLAWRLGTRLGRLQGSILCVTLLL